MIQLEPEGSTQGYPLDSVEVLRKIQYTYWNPSRLLLKIENLPDHRSNPSRIRRILKDGCEGSYEVLKSKNYFVYSDTERLSQSDEVLKLKNLKERCIIKSFQVYISRKMLKITYSLTSQAKRTSSSLKVYDHCINSQVKDYELKTKFKA
ncbi:hypothetical protein Tco_0290172 [Tanacetum coccineum]